MTVALRFWTCLPVCTCMHTTCLGPLAEAVERGLVNTTSIDAAVRRVLNHKFSAGLFDKPYVSCQLSGFCRTQSGSVHVCCGAVGVVIMRISITPSIK